MDLTAKNGEVVASYQVEDEHQIMLVSDAGQLIRMPVKNIRFVGRSSQGVTLFKVSDDEKVVSVTRVRESDEDEETDNLVSSGDIPTSPDDIDSAEEETPKSA